MTYTGNGKVAISAGSISKCYT